MKYSLELDRRTLKKVQLQQLRADLLVYANGAKPDVSTFEKSSVEYRHLKQAPTLNLMKRANPVTVGGVAFGGWYPLTNLYIHHAATIASAPNKGGGNFPVLEYAASVGVVGSGHGGGTPTKVCVGVSSDGGATWAPLDGTAGTRRTQRFLGDGSGRAFPMYAQPTQHHYMTWAPGYRPINVPHERPVELLACFGGDEGSHGDPSTLDTYTVMIDATLTNDWDARAWATLDAREWGF